MTRRYFSLPKSTTDTCPCNDSNELAFFLEVVNDFKELVKNYPVGYYPATVEVDLKFKSEAKSTETIQLSLEGTVMFIYIKMFNERYPSAPFTELQCQRINTIWEGIGHPENKI